MNFRLMIVFFLLNLALLAACGSTPNPGLQPEDDAQPVPRPTITNIPTVPSASDSSGYPAPPPIRTSEAGYILPTVPPTVDPYVAGVAWVVLPIGEQCAEPPPTVDLAAAVETLTEIGIVVQRSELTAVSVCAACGCPTSNHYRALIRTEAVPQAESVGWSIEP